MKTLSSPHINTAKKTIEFSLQDDGATHVSVAGASQVCLAGSFNNWAHDTLAMTHEDDGIWKIEIPMLPRGKYHYKFFVDDKVWMEDIENPYREPDGSTGFYSILTI
ncbi:MAG: glycogen-binding domain-containing protein [Chitinophagaceae bacterium]